MTIGIYGFVKQSKIVYIGKSINIEKRIQRHLQDLRKNIHCNSHFQRSFNKYGEDEFSWRILEECKEEDLNDREVYLINHFNTLSDGYNQNKGGDGGARTFGVNTTHTDETVLKIAELLEKGLDSNSIAIEVFQDSQKVFLDYISRIRRKELRQDLLKDFMWDKRLNSRRQISDQMIEDICVMIQRGYNNKEISLKVFGDWNKNRVNYLTKIRKRKARKDITKKYDW